MVKTLYLLTLLHKLEQVHSTVNRCIKTNTQWMANDQMIYICSSIFYEKIRLAFHTNLFDNLIMLSNGNGSTNTLAGSMSIWKKKKRRRRNPISFKYVYQGRKSDGYVMHQSFVSTPVSPPPPTPISPFPPPPPPTHTHTHLRGRAGTTTFSKSKPC